MMFKRWTERSLLAWIAIGMALTVLPLAISSVVIQVFLNGAAIAAFDDVATRYRSQISPTQHLQVVLWEVAVPVEEFLDAREPTQQSAFRALRVEIQTGFSGLDGTLASDPATRALLRQAEGDWAVADQIATELLAHPHARGDQHDIELADRFRDLIGTTVGKLRTVENGLGRVLEADHVAAAMAYRRARWVSGVAAGVSLLAIILGVAIVMRLLMVNVGRLVEGARRFAEGDRDHRIAVSVPPELREVADEFNQMIVRIRSAEDALVEQSRRDVMTGLSNRRAFDEALATAFARMRRLDEPVVLLTLDVDHFKRVNDTHGHAGGDAVLRAVAQTVASTIREVDKAFRVGGEEFAVLLAGTDVAGAMVVAERLRVAIAAAPVEVDDGQRVTVTASIGVALADGTKPSDALLRAADLALYAAKNGGRNRVVAASGTDSVEP
jgi:diguanylate cyclase (GGDEF)-like protein